MIPKLQWRIWILIFNTDDEEPLLKDIPRDTSGSDEPFFKLPLPDEEEEDYYSDVVVVSRDDRDRVNYSWTNFVKKRITVL